MLHNQELRAFSPTQEEIFLSTAFIQALGQSKLFCSGYRGSFFEGKVA
jgi:hypothetical protein